MASVLSRRYALPSSHLPWTRKWFFLQSFPLVKVSSFQLPCLSNSLHRKTECRKVCIKEFYRRQLTAMWGLSATGLCKRGEESLALYKMKLYTPWKNYAPQKKRGVGGEACHLEPSSQFFKKKTNINIQKSREWFFKIKILRKKN